MSGIGAEDIKQQEKSGQNADGSKSMIAKIQFNEQYFLMAYYVKMQGTIKV